MMVVWSLRLHLAVVVTKGPFLDGEFCAELTSSSSAINRGRATVSSKLIKGGKPWSMSIWAR
jgi:hypothetical protein